LKIQLDTPTDDDVDDETQCSVLMARI